ncbi:putative phiE125 gp8 family phage protein [Sagittula marina]|uniref:Putative phiE125 gp8 family phage protein n=1 Tax=Sagittula marina TaxID=943940 RepID=A0A7W6DR32_9RHOB|nr:head-tail connector protein [Sagittula marina]MBB3986171.1 putative phiE125 gp8 family phage protein [Sagittula marina]
MRLTRISASATSPVTLGAVKAYLRVLHDDEDALIQSLIDAAVTYLDGPMGILGRPIMLQTWEVALDSWPASELRLPVASVTSATVDYYDSSGVVQTLPPDSYSIDPLTEAAVGAARPVLRWVGAFARPELGDGLYPVRLELTGGAADAGALDAGLATLVTMIAGEWYKRDGDGGAAKDWPMAIEALLARYRVKL